MPSGVAADKESYVRVERSSRPQVNRSTLGVTKNERLYMTTASSVAIVGTLLLIGQADALRSQEPQRLGLNLSVPGSVRIGLTYHPSETLVLRPAIGFRWYDDRRTVLNTQSERTFAQYGGDLDLLLPLTKDLAVRPYVGASGGLWFSEDNLATPSATTHALSGAALFGVFARVITRVHVYGEVALRYSAMRGGGQRSDQMSLSTVPLGVLVYFK
jgi:hypothetical protein